MGLFDIFKNKNNKKPFKQRISYDEKEIPPKKTEKEQVTQSLKMTITNVNEYVVIKSLGLEKITSHGKSKYLICDEEKFVEDIGILVYNNGGCLALHSENHYWWHILALLFWEVIYAIEHGYEMFIKLYSAHQFKDERAFYTARNVLIYERIEELKKVNLVEEIKENYKTHYGERSQLIQFWDEFELKNLLIVAVYLDEEKLLKIMEHLAKNYYRQRSGFPDLIVFNEKKFFFAEQDGKQLFLFNEYIY